MKKKSFCFVIKTNKFYVPGIIFYFFSNANISKNIFYGRNEHPMYL